VKRNNVIIETKEDKKVEIYLDGLDIGKIFPPFLRG